MEMKMEMESQSQRYLRTAQHICSSLKEWQKVQVKEEGMDEREDISVHTVVFWHFPVHTCNVCLDQIAWLLNAKSNSSVYRALFSSLLYCFQ